MDSSGCVVTADLSVAAVEFSVSGVPVGVVDSFIILLGPEVVVVEVSVSGVLVSAVDSSNIFVVSGVFFLNCFLAFCCSSIRMNLFLLACGVGWLGGGEAGLGRMGGPG